MPAESTAPRREVDVVVVGAGFAGVYMTHKLRDLGFDLQSFEAGSDVGGTWYWNRYPGARCDIHSLLYAYSFDEELVKGWDWSEKYSSQPEILAYIEFVADKLDIRRSYQFDTRVTSAHFADDAQRWTVTTDRGETLSAQYLVAGVGALSKSKPPEVDGLDSFRGAWFHTGEWPDEEPSFSGLHVGVIGTGSSGIQVIPQLAERAGHVTVFQRTPNFTLPAMNEPIDPELVATVRETYPAYYEAAQRSRFGVPAPRPEHKALELTKEERDAVYEERWKRGELIGVLSAFRDLLTDRAANETAGDFVRNKIRAVVDDSEVAETLVPRGYAFGAKRPCLDTDYYATYNRANVTLVDLGKTPLVEIYEHGVRTTGEDIPLDVLVFATGFDAMTGPLLAMNIRGRNGLRLADAWREGPLTYLGLSIPDFPNLFTITGPGSPSVISNMVVSIEQHVDWIADTLEYLRKHDAATIEATDGAAKAWTAHVQELADRTLYAETDSWFTGANVPGKPRIFMPYIGGVGEYRRICNGVADDGYRGFEISR